MGSRYLTDLVDVVRATGLVTIAEPGWETRSRSSGGYDAGRPDHVAIHHTASGASSDGQADVNYMCYGSDNRPIANLYLARDGRVWVMAAGGSNTNGTGTCPHCGTTDNLNVRAIGIECANNGVGEPYPDVQQRAYAILVEALALRYGIANAAIVSHAEYAPSRKVDPAGPSRWATGSATWDEPRFRSDVAAGWPNQSFPFPEEGDPVDYFALYRNTDQYSLFARSGVFVVNITNAERDADKATRDPDPPTVKCYDATALKSLILVGDEPVWYDGSKWPPVSAFGGHLA